MKGLEEAIKLPSRAIKKYMEENDGK